MASGNYYVTIILLKVVLPIILVTCIMLRQTALSALYLLLFFILPYVPVPATGCTGAYLITMVVFSVINIGVQVGFQIFLMVYGTSEGIFEKPDHIVDDILRLVGLMRFNTLGGTTLTLFIAPDIIMFITSITMYLMLRKSINSSHHPVRLRHEFPNQKPLEESAQFFSLRSRSKYLALILLFLTGALSPSIPNAIYYIVFLGGATWWACFRNLGKSFVVLCRFISFIAAVHVTAILMYQTRFFQHFLAPRAPLARYFGLAILRIEDDSDPRHLRFSNSQWPDYANPIAVCILYFFLALQEFTRERMKDLFSDSSFGRKTVYSEDTPLISSVGHASHYRSISTGGIKTDRHGSVTVTDAADDNIQMKNMDNNPKQGEYVESTCLELAMEAILSIFQLLIRASYIATNIIMMAWSITYHSWLTFVLLLWASVLWMIPNQRRSMLRCSPYIVIYAEFLLLSQYIYGMDLTDEELPTVVNDVKLNQIGFYKPNGMAVEPIVIKTLYTTMFWITMRQYFKEKWEKKQTSALSDMAAPFRVSVSTANAGHLHGERSPWVKSFGMFVKKLMTKFWIWVVAISLFVIGITGNRITVFRIVYMGLFLVFILTFQISYRAWRRMMYGFWLTVIIYSMCILVLVYTYQFDNFPEYWEKYLRIPNQLQLDIGLEIFETTELFIRLLAPTFFVVITVVQLHYFHKDFLVISDLRNRGASVSRSAKGSSRSDGSSVQPEETVPPPSELAEDDMPLLGREKISLRTLRQLSSAEIKIIINSIKQMLLNIMELIMLFLELHMLKIVLLSIILLCCYNVTATHLCLVILCVVAALMGSKVQTTITHICSFIIAILFLLTMIYQIQYIQQDIYKWNCTNMSISDGDGTFVANNSEWLGFRKATPEVTLVTLLQGYIGVFAAITSHAVINTRQRIRRQETGRPRPYTLFPGITRETAETNIRNCLKYLVNYGFYKFGVEICLMALVGVIGSRMDFYALIYAVWLLILFSLSRVTLTRVWNSFKIFIAVMIPFQYLLVIGPPPGFCIDYPWYSSIIFRRLQNWMFLPDPIQPPSAYKIVCDFILLLLISRQSLCFRIEKRHRNTAYAGGSNDVVVQNYYKTDFVNPYLDHMTYTKSWLDLLKKAVFSALLWITLAVTFTAGTSRVNLFSIGYLIGSFIFLWQGNDLYLRRIESILNWWNWLLGYNILVIFLKTLQQIPGCIFLEALQDNACWVVQLFGIGCVNKFGHFTSGPSKIGECTVPDADIGLAWDGFCFGFLLIQRRFFNSYYFFHHIDETKAMTVLQSRGAELIEELRQHQLRVQQAQERKVLEKIRRKMDRIKASQRKVYRADTLKSDRSHFSAIRSGDYYLFDDIDDELDLIKEDEDESSSEVDELDGKKRFTMSKFFSTALKTDLTKAADQALTAEGQEDVQPTPRIIRTRRASMPASILRRKSSVSRRTTGVTGSVFSAPSAGTSFQITRPRPDIETSKSAPTSEIGSSKPEPKRFSRDGRGDDDEFDDGVKDIGIRPTAVKEKVAQKLWQSFKVLWAFFESMMVSIIRTLNKISKDYRYVVRVLAQEKRELKESTKFVEGSRNGTTKVWKPQSEVLLHLQEIFKPVGTETETEREEWSAANSPVWLQLLLSAWYALISHSELVCYFVIFLHQIKSPTLLSLPLPLMVFLWGSLTMPRPTKTFWITIIAYTEVVVIIKCLFQFEILPWNQTLSPENNPFYPPRIIGIEKKHSYASSDLLLLLIIFFHRYMLKSLGLWKNRYEDVISNFIDTRTYSNEDDKKSLKISQNAVDIQSNKGSDIQLSGKKVEIEDDELDDRSLRSSEGTASNSGYSGRESPSLGLVRRGKNKLKKTFTCLAGDNSEPSEDRKPISDGELEGTFDKFPNYFQEAGAQYCTTTKTFFSQLLDIGSRLSADVYAYMFICDFFNFLVVLFGFSAFGTQQGDGGVSAYLEENKVPVPFLLMMILQFALIVIDRALYLRKYILGKIIFQFVLVIGVHLWMFFVLPAITERPFNQLLPPQMWYMVKCFYLLMSAYQIRAGYPTRILGNFLCKKYNYINLYSFRGFMLVPFLFELRALMDWIWTDTSMTLSDWLKMEDIFAQIFQLKCLRRVEAEYPLPRGEKKRPMSKYLLGGAGLFLIIAIIWFPLVLFALGNTVGESNLPYDVTISLRIGAYQYIYQMSAQNNTIYMYSENQFDSVTDLYKSHKNREALTFLSNYQFDDVAVVKLSGNSTVTWGISPPDQILLLQEVESNQTLSLKFRWKVSRVSNNPEMVGDVTGERQIYMPPFINGKRNPKRIELANMLRGENATQKPVVIENILPKFIKITNKGRADAISKLMYGDEDNSTFRNISIKLKTGESSIKTVQQWWEVSELCDDENYKSTLSHLPLNDCKLFITIFTFNDKAFPATLSFISGKGIIGLYVSIVFVMWTLVRGYFTGISSKIMFDDMPNVDRILQLCLDIYLVRESYEFALEEDLFAKLVFLYRSPETIIKWTREREDTDEDEEGGDGSQLPSIAN